MGLASIFINEWLHYYIMIHYPSVDEIIEFNLLALHIIKVTKADAPKVLSKSKIFDVVKVCERHPGDVYNKAVI